MYFNVIIFGKDPENQLKPFDENLETEPYLRGIVSDEQKQDFILFCKEEHPEYNSCSLDELYKEFGNMWNSNIWEKSSDGVWEVWSTYNPKSKYDRYGLYSGERRSLYLNDGKVTNQAFKSKIQYIDTCPICSILKDGEWYEFNRTQIKDKISNLFESVPDYTLISVYNCHM